MFAVLGRVCLGVTVSALGVAAALVATRAEAAPDVAPPLDKTLSPYFFVEGGDPRVDALPLASTKVDVAVSGVVADVTVTQSYENKGQRPLHARYVFPASTRAAVHGMRMTIGDHVIEAKIREREQAKREFDAAKEKGKSATLLEEDRPNVFTMNVANVMPGDHIDVTLKYSELIVPEGGTYEFVYPTVVGPRYANAEAGKGGAHSQFVESPYLKAGIDAKSDFELTGTLASGIPVQSLESPTHETQKSWDNPNLVHFALSDKEKHGNNRDFVLRYGLAGSAIQSGLNLFDAGSEKFFLLLVEPPKKVTPTDLPPREYVFIVDVSGSMSGFPLDTAKATLKELVAGLRPQDTFNVLLFSGTSYLLSPRSFAASKENVTAALDAIDKQRAGGGTELLPALEQALSLSPGKGRSRTFVVVTDGYIEADKNAIDYVRTHLGEANVFSFGIGSSVNRFLIEGLAKAGMGEPFVVTDSRESKSAATRFKNYVGSPVLTNVKVAYDGFDTYDVEPRAIPDVFAERPVVVYGKYRGTPKGTISVSGIGGTGAFQQSFPVDKIQPRNENRALVSLWARSRIAALGDFGFGETAEAEKRQITDLGLKYGLLTPYTSFIAVSQIIRNPNGVAAPVTQPSPLPAGVSEDAIGTDVQSGAEPELWLIVVALAAGVFFLTLRPSRRPATIV
jgi:Ca-activated chloride channel family protein